jgi:protein-L-isoaspartate(D-aspartate) O-methyltransferase
MTETDFLAARRAEMVEYQIYRRGIRDPRLLQVLRQVPRHCFLPENLSDQAYQDGALPIGMGQTISQPYIVAVMTDLLQLTGSETVLEIGTGSGYQAAVLGRMAAVVHTVEVIPALAAAAAQTLAQLGMENVHVHLADGSALGWPPAAPYAGILVTAAAPSVPKGLLDQLAKGGSLILPVGSSVGQELQRWTRTGSEFTPENLFPVSFVPLRGQAGWSKEDWAARSNIY